MQTRFEFIRAAGAAAVGLAGAGLAAAQDAPWPQPTKAEILASIQRAMTETYLSENGKSIWGNTGITVEITEPKFGRPLRKQLYLGKSAEPAWPVRIAATVTVTSTKRPVDVVVWGGKPSDVWLFHKNAFDEWVYKIGSE